MLNLENSQTAINLEETTLIKLNEALEVVMHGEGVMFEPEVSLYLVDDDEIKGINKFYRGLDSVTDVLSFPSLEFESGKVFSECYYKNNLLPHMFNDERLLLGDVMISGQRANQQAFDFGHSLEREMVFLFVHSLLHLLGYDHIEDSDRRRMTARERHYMDCLGVDRS